MQIPTTLAQHRPKPLLWTLGLTALVVIASDLLLFDAGAGINLFVTVVAMAIALATMACRRRRYLQGMLSVLVAIVMALPLIETPSLLAIMLAAIGLGTSALIAVRLLPDRLERMPGTLLRFALPAPATLLRDTALIMPVLQQQAWHRAGLWLVAWIVPIVLGAVFAYLFTAANPLIEAAFAALRPETALNLLDPMRLVFWLVMAMVVWALLRPRLFGRRRHKPVAAAEPIRESVWLGRAAILRSLVVFNALFAVQTALDLAYLWGGVALPDGMSHAEYAHRGAYPLIVTALLAAAFVLAAMRENGAVRDSRMIRVLVYVFIGQNVLLCVSAMLRLELYVEVYLLTELRLAAGIWMGLVAVGLVLILLRIWLRRSNGWLVATNLVSLTLVLYATSLLDLSGFIARYNVEHAFELTGQGQPVDLQHLQELGVSAIPAFDRLIPRLPQGSDRWFQARARRAELARDIAPQGGDWRSWSWRAQRLTGYLAMHAVASAPPKRQNEMVLVR